MILYIGNPPFCRAKKIVRKITRPEKHARAAKTKPPWARGAPGVRQTAAQMHFLWDTRVFGCQTTTPSRRRPPRACMRVAVPPYLRLYTRPPRARVHARERAHGRGQVRACAPASSCCGGASVTVTRATLPVMATGAFKRRLGIAACTRAEFSRRP